MRIVAISRQLDTVTGLRFAGIDSVLVGQNDNVEALLKKVADDLEVGVILITEGLLKECAALVEEIKNKGTRPLISVVPDRNGRGQIADSISRYVQEAVGIQI